MIRSMAMPAIQCLLLCHFVVKRSKVCFSGPAGPRSNTLTVRNTPEMPFQFRESKNVILVNCNAKSMRIKIKLRLNVSRKTSKYASI